MKKQNRWMWLMGIVLVSVLSLGLFYLFSEKEAPESAKDPLLQALTSHDWVRMNDGVEEHIVFNADGHFSYYEPSSGNAVGDFDLYDTFEWNAEEKSLTLSPVVKGEEAFTMTDVSIADGTLQLTLQGKALTFRDAESSDLD